LNASASPAGEVAILRSRIVMTTSCRAADVLALQRTAGNRAASRVITRGAAEQVQRAVYPNMPAMWNVVHPGYALANVQQDAALASLYDDAAAQLPLTDIVQVANQAPQASVTPSPPAPTPYRVEWDAPANINVDDDYFAGAILHELAHVASAEMYRLNVGNPGALVWANMNLPVATGPIGPSGLAPNQLLSLQQQVRTIDDNWTDLDGEAQADLASGDFTQQEHAHVAGRIQYAQATAFVHNDTVLGDLMYWLMARGLDDTRTYAFARRILKEANDRRRNGFWSAPGTEVRRVDSRAWWFQFWKW